MQPYQLPHIIAYSQLLSESFARWLGYPLIVPDPASPEALAQALYEAPFVLVSHGTETDPVFRYANRAAQTLWGIGWDEFTRMPSRLSAEPVAQEEREGLLQRAASHGYVDDYRGVRIAKNGKRFEIRDTILWNVITGSGRAQRGATGDKTTGSIVRHGQAAMFKQWTWL